MEICSSLIKRFEKKGEGYVIYICDGDGNEKILN